MLALVGYFEPWWIQVIKGIVIIAVALQLVPVVLIAERKLAQHAAGVFVYLFAWETPVLGGRLRSCHTLEIPFVFNNLETAELTGSDPKRLALGDRVSRAWIAFARNGKPGHAGLPDWPAYSTVARSTMIFDSECRMENDPYAAERRAFAA